MKKGTILKQSFCPRLISLILILLLVSGCAGKNNSPISSASHLDGLMKKLDSIFELEHRVIVGKVQSVANENALISYYDIDITDYTVYTIEVINDISGFISTELITAYSIGNPINFMDRVTLAKNETYILTLSPWVYGDKVIYLLPTFQTITPQVDIANRVIISEEEQRYDIGSLDDYLTAYQQKKEAYLAENPGFFDLDKALLRQIAAAEEIFETNSDKTIYKSTERDYLWVPDEQFIDDTIAASKFLLDALTALKNSGEPLSVDKLAAAYVW